MMEVVINGNLYLYYNIDGFQWYSLLGYVYRDSLIHNNVRYCYHPITRLLITSESPRTYTFGILNPTNDEVFQEMYSYNFHYLLENNRLFGLSEN